MNYREELENLLEELGTLNVAVIGANDGKEGDPFYKFYKRNKERVNAFLIEPQHDVYKKLARNYPDSFVFNGAVGSRGVVTIYSVHPDAWRDLKSLKKLKYSRSRFYTGKSSSNKNLVLEWYKKKHKKDLPSKYLVSETVPCLPLMEAAERCGFNKVPDVIQCDTEGMDDEVLYNCPVDNETVRIVMYEHNHLSEERSDKLKKYLGDCGFSIQHEGRNSLALR